VSAAKFPPLGVRGFGSPFAHTNFSPGIDATSYLRTANDNLLTIVQIETREALDTVEQIAATPGIDVLFVGPFDLGNALGDPMIDGVLSEGLETAIERIIKAARGEGKKLGIYAPTGEMARKCGELGFDMISVTADSISISAWIGRELAVAKGGDGSAGKKPSGPYGG
jgi:4-hydroxy-2-oxoheptanedioate aldolase